MSALPRKRVLSQSISSLDPLTGPRIQTRDHSRGGCYYFYSDVTGTLEIALYLLDGTRITLESITTQAGRPEVRDFDYPLPDSELKFTPAAQPGVAKAEFADY